MKISKGNETVVLATIEDERFPKTHNKKEAKEMDWAYA